MAVLPFDIFPTIPATAPTACGLPQRTFDIRARTSHGGEFGGVEPHGGTSLAPVKHGFSNLYPYQLVLAQGANHPPAFSLTIDNLPVTSLNASASGKGALVTLMVGQSSDNRAFNSM